MQKEIHVAVGVVINQENEVLVALRNPAQHQGGLWEFPGGKVEQDEDVFTALQREFLEEVGLTILGADSLLLIQHDYGDKQVRLDVWLVREFSGSAHGKEGQRVMWQPVKAIDELEFPAANEAIRLAIKNL